MKHTTTQIILSILLLLQLAGVAIDMQQTDSLNSFVAEESFLTFDPENLSELRIQDSTERVLRLKKKGHTWILPDLQGFPASSKKVQKFLRTLNDLQRSYPTARSVQAQKQLRVAEKKFERKLSLLSGDVTELVYFGTTPGFKKLHARRGDEIETYTVPIVIADLTVEDHNWMDRRVLFLDREDITEVALPTVTLKRADDEFTIGDRSEQEIVDQKVVDRVLVQLAKMTYIRLLKQEEYKNASEVLRVRVQRNDADPREYIFHQEAEEVILSVSDLPFRFLVGKGPYTILKDLTREDLVTEKSSTDRAEAEPAGATDGTAPDSQQAASQH